MKVGYQWLKDYVSMSVSVEELAHRLTMAGMEVESMTRQAGDTVLEMEVTPNRPDCLNVIGLAREVSAVLNKPLKPPKFKRPVYPKTICPVSIEDKAGCRRYIGTIIRGVSIQSAPAALTQRLSAIGTRAINNVVDITNFVLLEMGQPLHAFDYEKLIGGCIMVRRAKKGEKIVTIDGIERELDPSILVIADAQRPVAIAGIMGGKDTEVTESTKNILLESAYFDSVLIRRASRKLGLSSDSSYRFERGVDLDGVRNGSDRAAALILQHAGGRVEGYKDVYVRAGKKAKSAVTVSVEDITGRLGATIPAAQSRTILKRLGFGVAGSGATLKVTAPSFRNDIRLPIDIIEEVARVIGYDRLPTSLPHVRISSVSGSASWELKKRIRRAMTAQGFSEAITYSLISATALERTGLRALKGVAVQNPLSQDQALMRPSMLPSFLASARGNINHGQKDLRLFELGKIYPPKGERETLAVLTAGTRHEDWQSSKNEPVNFYDLKGAVEALFNRLGLGGCGRFVPVSDGIFSTGEGAEIFLQNESIGQIGRLKKEILDAWDIKQGPVYFAQVDLPPVFRSAILKRPYRPVCGFPAITRDISIAVGQTVPFAAIQEGLRQSGGDLLTGVQLIEEYLGEKIPAGQRGLVISLTYQSPQRTLTEEEVNALHAKVIGQLTQKFQAAIR